MKIHMPNCRPDRRQCPLAIVTLLLFAAACSSVPRVGPASRQHPVQLIGVWVDVAKTTSTDSSLWILSPSGEDASQHVRRDTTRGASAGRFALSPRKRYGYWFAQGEMSDSASRQICFTNRPGRSAPSCVSFSLDSLLEGAGVRRRLLVHGYHGEHRTSDRVLLARDP